MSRYRRSRLEGGTYFFTLSLADRRSSLLVERVENLRMIYRQVCQALPFKTVAICVLPDHLHAIWTLPGEDADYSRRWGWIKSGFSRALPAAENRTLSKLRQREKGIWQRRFWEHTIADLNDLQRHVDYIHGNPLKHGLVDRVRDWPYSSFHRWVREGRLPLDWAGETEGGMFGE
ncbi:REP-associated tyrosine transposase [Chromobacterium haemolyticum]|uniref:REP-associated tyrosine transposase n=1 Tax=Chromobacterium haemolyticum TaxID=394935 RepID=UPI00307DBC6F